MKAVVLPHYGGADDLQLREIPPPPVGAGEVLVKLKATSVNPVDWKLGAGYLDAMIPGEFPLIPGWDAAGIVTDVGAAVTGVARGDEVFGYVRRPIAKWGTYAEYTVAEPHMVTRKPPSLDWASAGGLSLTGLAALQALDAVGVTEGDTVLVHAAAGGVGVLAVQIAKARGARVIGTASVRNHDFLRAFGAEPVEYGPGLAERVKLLVPDGPDAALDAIGGEAADVSLKSGTAPERIVSVVDPDIREKGGQYVFISVTAEDLEALAALTEARQLIVPISETYPLERTADAWRASMSGRTRGKIVLRIA
ncbi:NADP-dependent oxidoreductase [Glycomyces harbinensis]|uniref:NADPH:quinone reductase n=1 Tax=Glycomyces harbinensis TaxID=58114 RepID=A0A1G6WJ28_9ACTN|nr:NADP-dependent oxidoreductase [Glycomyces harbinensis]SDD65784.1 NADPH:quinone reductase [Glycomyces harbinensis]